ncbi:PspC domain-containing protein [Persicitalea sp.]|uniref:PspC domain-containing protein n=1 Tax=Persicitalea sp. TaxID=3100273 RepID=UPI00359381FF
MKKTISINIGGVVFHIEEDGYEKLRDYLGSVQRYFSSFADSKEILSDIEGRIAERFIAKQKAENKQVISLENVDELIAAMGTVADFEAIDQAEDLLTEPLQAASSRPESDSSRRVPLGPPLPNPDPPRFAPGGANLGVEASDASTPRRLYRDLRRKLVGGVASGIAHYFTVDPIWVRLAFLVLVVGLPIGSGMMNGSDDLAGSLSGLTVLIYIAMWIAFPGSNALEEDKSIKKFYRDPDRKVVGGVAAGVASYFGVDIGVVRFVWVLTVFFFGTGFLIYIVLWVISPSANTLTEKMEMQGEPITLTNIETNIKRGLNLEESPTTGESGLTRLLLFPFRAIAVIISGLGKLLKGIGPILRIVIGAVLVAVGAAALLGLLVGGSVGMTMRDMVPFNDIPPLLLLNEAPSTLIFSIALLVGIPFLVILLLGLTLIANRRVASGTLWLTLAGLWVVGIIGVATTGTLYQRNFARRGEVQQTDRYAVYGTPLLDEYDNDAENGNNWDVRLMIEGYAGDSIQVERETTARGRSTEDARRNAMDLSYRIVQKDSVLRFDEEPTLAPGGKFRDQEVRLRLLMPYDRPFVMTRNFFYRKISNWEVRDQYRELDRSGDREDWRKLRWAVKRDSGLVCLNLPEKYRQEKGDSENGQDEYDGDRGDILGALSLGERGDFVKEFDVRNFQKIEIGGAYAIDLRQGDRFAVTADGDREDVERLTVSVEDGRLLVRKKDDPSIFDIDNERIGLQITMPDLRDLKLSGASKARVSGFQNLDRLYAELSGAVESEFDIRADRLELEATGASNTTLKGRARTAKISLTGACKLDATDMEMDEADVRAVGASRAEMGKVRRMSKTSIGASKID